MRAILILPKLLMSDSLKQARRYFVVGLFAFLVDTLFLNIFRFRVFNGNSPQILNVFFVDKLFSSIVGLSVSFFLNRTLSFDATHRHYLAQLPRMIFIFMSNTLAILVIYSIYFNFLQNYFFINFGELTPTIANGLTAGTQMFINFFIYKFIVFR